MNKLDAASLRYWKAVKRELRFSAFPGKREVLAVLADDLLSFREDLPDADYPQVCAQFGQPEKFAENVLDTVDPAVLKAGRKRRRILLAAAIVVLAAALALVSWHWYKLLTHKGVYATETLIIYEEVP